MADPTLVNFYNQGQTWQRFAINKTDDYCHWFRISDALLAEVVAKDQRHFSQENMPCPAPVFLQHLQLLQLISGHQVIDQLQVEEAVLALFQGLLSQTVMDSSFRRQNHRHKCLVERDKDSLHADLSVNLSLGQLSALHPASPCHLSRVSKHI